MDCVFEFSEKFVKLVIWVLVPVVDTDLMLLTTVKDSGFELFSLFKLLI